MKRGSQWCVLVLAVLSVAATTAFAGGKGSATGLNCTVTDAAPGIGSDGNPYNHGTTSTSPKCFLGAGGKNFNLMTYSSGRTLKFSFVGTADQGLANLAGLQPTVNAEVDAYGINYFGQYLSMQIGSTAQVQMDVQFHYGGGSTTYELSYSCLAVRRTQFNTWVLTSGDPDGGNVRAVPCLSNKATLSKIRRNSGQVFGDVTMPVTIEFSQQ